MVRVTNRGQAIKYISQYALIHKLHLTYLLLEDGAVFMNNYWMFACNFIQFIYLFILYCLPEGSATGKVWIFYTRWVNLAESFESLFEYFCFISNISHLVRTRKLGNQDSANPRILSESIKIQNLVHFFFTLWIPRVYHSIHLYTHDIHICMKDFNRPVCNRYIATSVEVMISQYSISYSEKNSKYSSSS